MSVQVEINEEEDVATKVTIENGADTIEFSVMFDDDEDPTAGIDSLRITINAGGTRSTITLPYNEGSDGFEEVMDMMGWA